MEATYGRWAAWYDDLYRQLGLDPERELAPAMPWLRGKLPVHGARILDLGCGTGRMVGALSRLGSVAGVDASAAMLAVARRSYPASTFLHGRIEEPRNWRGGVGQVDLVAMLFGVCGYARSPAEAQAWLAAAASVLRPGGLLLVGLTLVSETLHPPREQVLKVERGEESLLRRAVARLREDGVLEIELSFVHSVLGREVASWREMHSHLVASRQDWLGWIASAVGARGEGTAGGLLVGGEFHPAPPEFAAGAR